MFRGHDWAPPGQDGERSNLVQRIVLMIMADPICRRRIARGCQQLTRWLSSLRM